MENFPRLPWHRQISSRALKLWPLKAVGTTAFMFLFFWGYFGVLHHPRVPPLVMPLTMIDAWISFSALAFPAYASLWVYVTLPLAVIGCFRPLALFGAWMAALCLFCLFLFWIFPTAVPPAVIDWERYPEMSMLKGIDATGNACPSLHVASAVFAACWLQRMLRNFRAPTVLAAGNWAICAAILWSTVATRQHVVLDVLAGSAVGLVFAALSLRHAKRRLGQDGF